MSGFPDFAERRSRDIESSDRIDLGEEEQASAGAEPEQLIRCESISTAIRREASESL
uniref:Uncharacterized protein n=1 Tax=Thermogemmatispora argillosa TaxID=2045280 RepID=A0A455T0Y6_9CHLR|nr:hypothetical protein KTA_24060 [Thermogemmatispora argillosa]